MFIQNKELKIKMIENRIELLRSRGETMNSRIIHKLERKLRHLKAAV